MKINFTKLPTTDSTIKVSLDGGQSFTDYSIADIHESGVLLSDDQDYEKIQIQAPANVLKNLNVVSKVKVGNANLEDIASVYLKDFNGNFDTSILAEYPNVKNVVIPDGVTEIPENAFNGISLKTITIPESVKSIGSNAFKNCDATLIYKGASDRWSRINKAKDYNPNYYYVTFLRPFIEK